MNFEILTHTHTASIDFARSEAVSKHSKVFVYTCILGPVSEKLRHRHLFF